MPKDLFVTKTTKWKSKTEIVALIRHFFPRCNSSLDLLSWQINAYLLKWYIEWPLTILSLFECAGLFYLCQLFESPHYKFNWIEDSLNQSLQKQMTEDSLSKCKARNIHSSNESIRFLDSFFCGVANLSELRYLIFVVWYSLKNLNSPNIILRT